ncbi:MAG: glycosyltransferase [Spirosomaceae bacterium]|nr:glycosyltransferase [Spirosomataceae bacterium]
MRILYDHQAFTGSIYGGVSRYFADLMGNLAVKGHDVNLATGFSNNFYLQDKSFYNGSSFSQFIGSRTGTVFSHLNRANAAYHLLRNKFDVFHPTFHNPYFLDFIGKKPFVVTYHDAIPEIYHQRYGILDGVKFDKKKKLLEKATQVIAVSENTKKDLLKFYDINPDKVSVVHHGSNFVKHTPTATSFLEAQHGYLLYIGARDLYKNFDVFVASIAEVLLKNNLRLLCVGVGDFCKK